MKIEDLTFFADGLTLVGTLHRPAQTRRPPVVIGSHGLFASRTSPKQIALAQKCCAAGIAYFRFDHRGCGDSQGRFQKVTSLNGRYRDMLAAIDTIHSLCSPSTPIALFGSSLGGTVSLKTAVECRISSLVVFAAPLENRPLYDAIKKADDCRELPDAFYLNQLSFDLKPICQQIGRILIFHGTDDPIVPVTQGQMLYERAQNPKKLILQKKGDHQMQSSNHQLEFMEETVQWFQQWFRNDRL